MKEVSFGKNALEPLLKGLDTAADAVSLTIGPCGRNVYIMDDMTPKITNDGATISNKIKLEDEKEDAGAWVIRNVSAQQLDDVGDGTSTVVVLTQAIIRECLARPENPVVIKESLEQAGKLVLEELAKTAKAIQPGDEKKIAQISAENEQLAQIITEIVEKLGSKAVVHIEDSKTFATDYEVVDGYEVAAGFMSPHMINDTKSGKAVYSDIPVLVTDRKIANIIDIQPLFTQLQENNIGQLVIVCDDIEDAMLGMLVANKQLGRFNALVIRCGGEMLQDTAGAVGAQVVSNGTGITFKDLKLEHLGHAQKVVANEYKTLFIVDKNEEYIDLMKSKSENEPNQWTKKHIDDRIARLTGGIANLRIGASTDLEREYLKMKADDAVKATKAALEEGIVEGGGFALWRLASRLTEDDIGQSILKKALTAPLRAILNNAGVDYTDVITHLVDDSGYNLKTKEYGNLLEMGIMDPIKVERCALENAVSAAATFITTHCLITNVKHD